MVKEREVEIPVGSGCILEGTLGVPHGATGVVVFAHGSGSSRVSPRNRYVAGFLQTQGLATLLMDLLTAEEEEAERVTHHLRFNVDLMAGRLVAATGWLLLDERTRPLVTGYFGASTGAAAALVAAAQSPDRIGAVVSRGGRPDLARDRLREVQAPTLLIVGAEDEPVLRMNEAAFEHLGSRKRLEVVSGATHLFEEPGTLEVVAQLASDWFCRYLSGDGLGTPEGRTLAG